MELDASVYGTAEGFPDMMKNRTKTYYNYTYAEGEIVRTVLLFHLNGSDRN